MKRDRQLLVTMAQAAAGAAALLAAFVGLGAGLVWSTLDAAQREALAGLLGGGLPLLVMATLAVVGAAAAAVQPLYRRWVAAPARLHEQAQVLLASDVQRSLSLPEAAPPVQALARTINELAAQRDQLRRDIAAEVAQASRGIVQERNRLAALAGKHAALLGAFAEVRDGE